MPEYKNIKDTLDKLNFEFRIKQDAKILNCNEDILESIIYNYIQDFYFLTIDDINGGTKNE